MQKIPWKTPFSNVTYLVCERFESNGDEYLEIELVEHHVVHDKKIIEAMQPPVKGAKPVLRTPQSQSWTVTFDVAVAFKGHSESYYHDVGADGGYDGRTFTVGESEWIKKINEQGTLAFMRPNCVHWVILTDHLIIEVVSPEPPLIET